MTFPGETNQNQSRLVDQISMHINMSRAHAKPSLRDFLYPALASATTRLILPQPVAGCS
jgi:hypothetical protein